MKKSLARGINSHNARNIIRKKKKEITSNDMLETAEEPSPTINIEKIRKGLNVKKSNITARTNDDVAVSNGNFILRLITYMYEREPSRAGKRSTNRFRMNVAKRIFFQLMGCGFSSHL